MAEAFRVLTIAHRFVEEFLGQGMMAVAAELLSESIEVITGLKPDGPIRGIAEYQQIFASFYDAFPPVQPLVIEDSFATADRAVVRFKSFQKHAKDFFGVPKSDRLITFHETHVMRFQDDKIVENIVSATNLEFEMLMAPVLTPLILP
jgi:predicted ester cyclase